MLMPPEAIEDTEQILGRIRHGEKVDHYETRRRRKDGTIIDVSLTVSPIRNAEGEIVGASKVGRDVTEKRQAERAEGAARGHRRIVRRRHRREDLDGIITSWNRGAERVLGYTAEEVIGQHVSMLMPPEAIEDTEKILGRIRRGEKVDHYETKRRRKDGTHHRRVADRLADPGRRRRIIGASKIGRDITAAEASSRPSGGGRPPEGRVPGDARPRAAEPARRHQQRRPALRAARDGGGPASGPRRSSSGRSSTSPG